MFLIKWIKEYFAIFFLGFILVWMSTFTLMSPSGFMGFLLWIGASVFASLMWNALCGLLIGPLYIILLRPALVIAIKVPLIIIRIFIFLFIATPLKFIGQSSSWIWNGFEASVGNLVKNNDGKRRPKLRFVAVFLFFLLGLTYVVGVDIETFSAMMRDATILAIPLMFVPLILTLIVSGVGVKLSGRSLGEAAEQSYDDRIDRVDQAADIAESAAGIYSDLDHINEHKKAIEKNGSLKKGVKDAASRTGAPQKAVEAGRKADSFVTSTKGLSRIAASLDEVPLIGGWLANLAAGVTGGAAIATLLVILLILIIVWVFVAIILVAVFGGVMYVTVFPFLESTFGVAAGFGADIGGVLSTGPSADLNAPSAELNALKLAGARVECMLQGPQCMRDWRRNNTERPGAESEGIEFGLEIEDFTVNSGQTLDISTRKQDDTIPIRFDVYNPIQGLKGIEARDVQYRVAVDGGPTTSCTSDWKDLGGQFVGDSNNAIAPGGFVRPGGELENLTLKDCGALQPGNRQDMSAKLEIKYDYSSQSTLQFQAMEQSYMIDEGIEPDPEESITADTPVRTYINVQSPITFRNPENGNGRAPITFPVYVGFETKRFDLEYQIHPEDLEIYSSSLLTDVERAKPSDFDIDIDEEDDDFGKTCSGLSHESGTEYELSNNYKERIRSSQQRGEWHTQGLGPTEAECSMVLAPDTINSISETGETLSMRIDGNYTVRLSSSSESFRLTNSRCGQLKCPFIVTKEQEEKEGGTISSECSTEISIDSTDGCTVIQNTEQWASNPIPVNRDNQLSSEIENRETAYDLENLVDNRITENAPSGEYIQFNSFVEGQGNAYSSDAAVGLEPRDVENANESNTGYAITATESGRPQAEIDAVEDYYLCEGEDADAFVSSVMDTENVIYYKVPTISCGPSLWEQLTGSVDECEGSEIQAFNERSNSKECIS